MDELQHERSKLHAGGRFQVDEGDVPEPVLVELRPCHRHRQTPAVDRGHVNGPDLAQNPRQRPEMVLVTMGHDDPLDVRGALAEIAEVRQHEVDPEHLGRRETQARIDYHDAPAVLEHGHVLADFAQPAEGQGTKAAHAAVASRPCRSNSRRIVSRSDSSSSTYGNRGIPTSMPMKESAVFTEQASGATASSR